MNWLQYKVLSFDCYGTLINWETGLLDSLRPILAAHDMSVEDDILLESFAHAESEIEAAST